MTIEYNPEDSRIVWPDGIYAAHIEQAEEKISKAGNRMIEFTFVCFHRLHGITRVWEHVVVPKQLWKLKLLAAAVGRERAYGSGVFRACDYVGAHMELELNCECSKGYPPKNVIVEFLPVPGGPDSAEEWREDLAEAISGDHGEGL